ncbi:3-deoxy-D-manno-octulosonic acid kinase [Haliea sp.]
MFNPAFAGVTSAWLTPGFWGEGVRAVATGGRGGAWFITAPQGEFVLREYLRGGLVARLSRASYLFTGFRRTRSLREFRLLQRLREQGLPVPEPVAALATRKGLLTYGAAILLRRITEAVPLPESPSLLEPSLWESVGRVLGRFHAVGLDHVDLNCDNLLHASDGIWLIDFDRCRLRAPARRWQQANLARLRRSVAKRCGRLSRSQQDALWAALLSGYREAQ